MRGAPLRSRRNHPRGHEHKGQLGGTLGISGVEGHGPARLFEAALNRLVWIIGPSVDDVPHVCLGKSRPGGRKLRVEFDGALKQGAGLSVVLPREAIEERERSLVAAPGFEVGAMLKTARRDGLRTGDDRVLGALKVHDERGGDRFAGQVDFELTVSGAGPDQLNGPLGLAVDDTGNLFIAETHNDRVQKFGFCSVR